MRIVEERDTERLRIRCVTWDEDSAYILVQERERRWPRSGDLWVCAAQFPLALVAAGLEDLCADESDRVVSNVARGIAMLGAPWEVLTARESAAHTQLKAWLQVPAQIEELEPSFVWMVRGKVFGATFTRVPAALTALDRFYDPDQPVPAGLLRWLA